MNKSIWFETATTTTEQQGRKQVQCNVRHSKEAQLVLDHSGGLVVPPPLFLSHLLRFLLHSELPVFLMGDSCHSDVKCQTLLLHSVASNPFK